MLNTRDVHQENSCFRNPDERSNIPAMIPEAHKLRIALISPKGPLYRHRGGIFRKGLRIGPLTLTTLASLIPPEIPHTLRIYDEGVEELPASIDADLVGMTVITGTAPRAYELAQRFRAEGKKVILGGPHPTLVPDEAAQHCDCVVTGYAEETWPQLLRDLVAGVLRPRYAMSSDFSFQRMATLPYAKRALLAGTGYKTVNAFEATRGCIHSCDFCVVPHAWGKRPFQKPVEHVIDDIRQSGAKRLVFYDLNLLADFGYARELFSALVPLKVKWFGLSTVLLGKDQELMDLCARSGCRGLLIGFETVSKAGLSYYNKRFNRPEEYGAFVRALHDRNIMIMGTFVFGNDNDGLDSFDAARDFILDHRIDLPRFSIMTPFPGTTLFKRLDHEERILTRDWSMYDGQHVVFQPKQLTAAELLYHHERVWKEVYSYRCIARRFRRGMEQLGIVLGANLAYRFYSRNLNRFYTCEGGLA
ncbi:MAG: radical SAM protein [Bdellovibrionota bacterium]